MLFTFGHSTHPITRFIEILHQHRISAIADVRSSPYSKFNPQFNREPLIQTLKNEEITYVFLGVELGARSEDKSCYVDGQVQFDRLAKTRLFQSGLDRLRQGMEHYRISLLCAEKDPIACHRTVLVCHSLRGEFDISHILEDGELENNRDTERRMMQMHGISEIDLLATPEEQIAKAYDLQGKKIAYVEK